MSRAASVVLVLILFASFSITAPGCRTSKASRDPTVPRQSDANHSSDANQRADANHDRSRSGQPHRPLSLEFPSNGGSYRIALRTPVAIASRKRFDLEIDVDFVAEIAGDGAVEQLIVTSWWNGEPEWSAPAVREDGINGDGPDRHYRLLRAVLDRVGKYELSFDLTIGAITERAQTVVRVAASP